MKIIQLTDLHIGAPDELPHGVDVRRNFLEILNSILAEGPDMLVITGDFCLKAPVLDSYVWIKQHLDSSKLPYRWIPGNHDDLQLMLKIFQDSPMTFPMLEHWNGFQIIFLDSSKGILDRHSIAWLMDVVDQKVPSLMFIHHPIFKLDVPYMDKRHAAQFPPTLIDHLLNFDQLSIFCGHYHIERSLQRAATTLYVCPSLYVQIDPRVEHFKPLHYDIGYRSIEIKNDYSLITSVIYQAGHRRVSG